MMHGLLSLNPTIGFAGGLGLAFLILLALELFNVRRVNKVTLAAQEITKKRAEEEASRMLEDARRDARKLVNDAETASLALTGTRKKEDESAEHAYEVALKDMLQKLE